MCELANKRTGYFGRIVWIMNAQVIKLGEGYFFLRIDNFLKLNELSEVWEEIKFFSYRSKLKTNTHSAKFSETGELKSNKIGVWLDDIFTDRKYSNFFKYYKKWITPEAFGILVKTNLFWRELAFCEFDRTLFSCYENETYYRVHQDTTRITQIYYTFKEPKKFTGGQIVFTDFNYLQEIENNMLIVFPSWFNHEVKPVLLNEKTPSEQDKLECNGRYSFTTFFS